MPEYQHYLDEIEGLKRSLSLSEITQEEYNKKVNEAKGALLAAADAAKIGGSEVEHLRAEFGNDSWRTTIDNIQTAYDALKAYNQTLEDIKNRMFYSSFDSENGLWEDRDMNKDYIKEMKKEFDDAADSQIRHSTWFRKAKYTSLKEAVPELFNADDSINMDALEEFMNSDMYSS